MSKLEHIPPPLPEIVGVSAAMQSVYRMVKLVAPAQATVLLVGETGTGKEVIAKALHKLSHRFDGPYIRVNCGALPETLLESELFGHVKGAFTGAIENKAGRFEAAHGGTLFLDEINSMSPKLQVKLLRVLQERSFERVGGSETIRVDVRVISATHQDLEAMVAAGKFREDLYYRLNVFPIFLPSLRDRLEDLPALCQHFLQKWRRHAAQRVTSISPEALTYLSQYAFPGNVRELENLIERALILAQGTEITPAELEFARPPSRAAAPPARLSRPLPATPSSDATSDETPVRTLSDRLMDKERGEILAAIERSEGNIAQAARMLGINRSTLYYRLRKHDLLHLLPTRPELLAPLP